MICHLDLGNEHADEYENKNETHRIDRKYRPRCMNILST